MNQKHLNVKGSKVEQLDATARKEWQRQREQLLFGCDDVSPMDEFEELLADSLLKQEPLRVKCGIDPTGFDIHLGHTVPYRKMRQFQDLGHRGVVVIGDYTAQIGDPTGKLESRKSLSAQEVKNNAERYLEQLMMILDPQKTEVRWQSEWFANKTLADVMTWAMQTTVAKLLSHDTYKVRLEQNLSLGLHELFYPVLQGLDSVYIKADVELGGSDQKFNVLMGRDYQRHHGLRPQVAMLLPIITGTCGKQKMSKSLQNYIALLDRPFDIFGKTMSIPDHLISEWGKLLTGWGPAFYGQLMAKLDCGDLHPFEAKKQLATSVVAFLHGEAVGQEMRTEFEAVFSRKELPSDLLELAVIPNTPMVDVLVHAQVVSSKSDWRRLVQSQAVSWHQGDKLVDEKILLSTEMVDKILKVGKKRFVKFINGAQ